MQKIIDKSNAIELRRDKFENIANFTATPIDPKGLLPRLVFHSLMPRDDFRFSENYVQKLILIKSNGKYKIIEI
jgi:hypothetical protein